jgi:hypothetical protein
MTPVILLDNLEEFIKKKTNNIKLQVRVRGTEQKQEKERAADLYKMRLPTKEDETEKVPYILLQFLTGKDGEVQEGSTCQIRIVVGTYAENDSMGAYDVLNVILRIRSELEKAGVIGGYFALKKPLEYLVYPDNTRPYFFGEMITNWSIPEINREVKTIWQ